MSEIEKMMQNADIKPDCTYLFLVDGNGENEAARTISIGSKADLKRLIVDCGVKGKVIKSTNTLKPFYPPFTAEKQLEITKFIGLRYGIKFIINEAMDYMLSTDLYYKNKFDKRGYGYGFDEAIANLTNNLWQNLTKKKKNK